MARLARLARRHFRAPHSRALHLVNNFRVGRGLPANPHRYPQPTFVKLPNARSVRGCTPTKRVRGREEMVPRVGE